jgi:cysteine-rich repeat protein
MHDSSNTRWNLARVHARLAVFLAGCDVVSEDQIRESDVAFLDQCDVDPELAVSNSSEPRRIDFSYFSNDRNTSAAGCGLSGLLGPEGYYMFESRPEQRWQIRATPTGNADVALYIDNGCDQDACVGARDRCGPGLAESFTFITPPSPTGGGSSIYSLVVDTHKAYEGNVDVVLVSSVCGDGDLDPGEGCDVGLNNLPGDGCSITCQQEIDVAAGTAIGVEQEPNESAPSANAVLLPPVEDFVAPVSVAGSVGGGCDDDVFGLSFGGGSITGRSLKVGLTASCDATPAVRLTVLSTLGGRQIGAVTEQIVEGPCATTTQVFAQGRSYFLRVQALDDGSAQFDYTLSMELLPET